MVAVGPAEQVPQRCGDVLGADDERVAVAVEVAGEGGRQVGEGGAVGESVADGGRPALGAEPLGSGVGDDPPGGEQDQPVGEVVGLVDVVGGEHDGGAGRGQVLDRGPRPPAGFGVEPGGRLVEEQHLGPADDPDGDVDPAALPAREGADPGLGVVDEVDQFEDLADGARCRVEPGEHVEGVSDGELGVEAGRLEHQPDPGPPPAVAAVGVGPEDPDGAAGGGEEAFEHLQGGGLAGPVGPEHGDQLAVGHLEAHAVDGREVPEALGQPVDDDGAHDIRPPLPICPWRRTRWLLSAPIPPQTSRTAPIPANRAPPWMAMPTTRRIAPTMARTTGPL